MPRLACLALSLLLAASFAGRESGDRVVSASNSGDTMNEQARGNSGDHLTADQTIADLLSHPAFSGFGRLLCRGTTALMTTGCVCAMFGRFCRITATWIRERWSAR